MSLFGTATQTGGSIFGQGANTNTGSIFGGNNQQQQPAQNTSIFGGNAGQNAQQNQQQGGGLFGGSSFGQNNQQQTSQQNSGFSFGGNNQQNQQQSTGLGGSTLGGGLFGGSSLGGNQNQNSQSVFGGGQQNQSQQPQLNASLYTPQGAADTSVQGQIQTIRNKWDTNHPDCAFRKYFYNKVPEEHVPHYHPTAKDDPKQWEEALSKKPGPGYIPVICVGFSEMGDRIKLQTMRLAQYNVLLHEINNSLEAMLSKHDLQISVRAMDAKRKHAVLQQRAMALASKVQILRNRGYALGGDEEDLKAKLQSLERGILDPGLAARAEEIWARMVGVRERARILKEEMNRRVDENGSKIDEETAKRAEKILEDYGKQLGHLKRELALVNEELKEWEKDQPQSNGR